MWSEIRRGGRREVTEVLDTATHRARGHSVELIFRKTIIFFLNDTATAEIYTIAYTFSLHDALPIW